MPDPDSLRKLVAPGCESCGVVESLLRAGVPLSQIEIWLDLNENRAPAHTHNPPAPVPCRVCPKYELRPAN